MTLQEKQTIYNNEKIAQAIVIKDLKAVIDTNYSTLEKQYSIITEARDNISLINQGMSSGIKSTTGTTSTLLSKDEYKQMIDDANTKILELKITITKLEKDLDAAYIKLYEIQENEQVELIGMLNSYDINSRNSILPYGLTKVWDDKKIDEDEKKYITAMVIRLVMLTIMVVILIKIFR